MSSVKKDGEVLFHEDNGVFQPLSNAYSFNYSSALFSETQSFYLGPQLKKTDLTHRNISVSGFVYDWKNPCNSRNFSQELAPFTLPFPILFRIQINTSPPCSFNTRALNIRSATLKFTHPSIQVSGLLLLHEYGADIPKFWNDIYYSASDSVGVFNIPAFNQTMKYNESLPYAVIQPNSLGSILERTTSTKPSDLPESVFMQRMIISGIIPSNSQNPATQQMLWLILSFVVLGVLIVIAIITFRRWTRNFPRTVTTNIALRPITTPATGPTTTATRSKTPTGPVLTEEQIAKIPCTQFDSAKPSKSTGLIQTTCSICLYKLNVRDEFRELPQCEHIFHKGCIDEWLLERSCFCPNCRLDVSVALNEVELDERTKEDSETTKEVEDSGRD